MEPDRSTPEEGGSAEPRAASAEGTSSSGRKPCPRCGKSCGGYCSDCVVVLDPAAPQGLRLPLRLHILQHGETNARSTALHAALMAPADVQLHRHAGSTTSRRCDPLALQLPEWDPASTAVLFPEGPDTPAVGDPACPPFQQLVVLESNWRKARGLLRHPRLAGLPRVQLPREVCSTEFEWRRGDGSFRGAVDEGLSSIEAIVHACRLLGSAGESYDSLLYFFRQQQAYVKKRGALPTSRQEARARQKKPRAARGQQERAAADGGGAAAPL
ncbi:DTW domain containing [Micractinium conductrix]|uniref:tRNA-uridine aminocarboxypropyltransferase 1 n=1 Tax=Micractinium conductrix TaxID=554055 RepID=A0A2P6V9V9_9CHLO|nr:DTW domain containing [Micractinium conductrix]|eukprot:PSC70879.1 DTW domain containing [Micractinium conductrix]